MSRRVIIKGRALLVVLSSLIPGCALPTLEVPDDLPAGARRFLDAAADTRDADASTLDRIEVCPSSSFADCDGVAANGCEVRVWTDVMNCSRCGLRCVAGDNAEPRCAAGVCSSVCIVGFANCDGDNANGCETDLRNDPRNCGACDTVCATTSTISHCSGGRCTSETCVPGRADCDGNHENGCETRLNFAGNCGACNFRCGTAQPFCSSGRCATSCPTGTTPCGGGCVSLQNDRDHCGACGRACSASEVCVFGGCARSCPMGGVACDGTCRDLRTDHDNCGACGHVCPTGQACSSGRCQVTCGTGLRNCSGVCRDLQTDHESCGACGLTCRANETCSRGTCVLSCRDADNDPDNCGRCGVTCAERAGATRVCHAGTCGFTCNAGTADCDRAGANGCEAVLQNDANNCGRCGARCSFPNALARCEMGECRLTSCHHDFGDCDRDSLNGCESYLPEDENHCGVCGFGCGDGRSCAGGQCTTLVCSRGWADCDRNASTDCEANLVYGEANCGACRTSCPAGQQCVGGECTALPCPPGRADCDGLDSNGCETSLDEYSTCGGCHLSCIGSSICCAGTCIRTDVFGSHTCGEFLLL